MLLMQVVLKVAVVVGDRPSGGLDEVDEHGDHPERDEARHEEQVDRAQQSPRPLPPPPAPPPAALTLRLVIPFPFSFSSLPAALTSSPSLLRHFVAAIRVGVNCADIL
jgi:hypothetical protein